MSTTTNSNIEGLYPLTGTQEGILYHSLLEDGGDLYVQQYMSTISGDLDVDRFRQAWDTVLARHPALRSLVVWEGRDDPLQLVRRKVELPWKEFDLSERAPEKVEGEIDSFLSGDRSKGFVLDEAPLMRLALFRLPSGDHRFVWTHHHIMLDGWSLQLVLDDVFDTYSRLALGNEVDIDPAPRFQAFVDHLATRDRDSAREYWSEYLSGFESANHLDAAGNSRESPWATTQESASWKLDQQLTAKLSEFGKKHDLTLNTVLRAAWALVISRHSGDNDVVFGATVAGRPPDLASAMETIGLFINTVPVRAVVSGEVPTLQWLRDLQADQNEMSPFEWTPLPEIQTWAETRPGQPLFTSLLVVENLPSPRKPAALAVGGEEYLQRSNYPLALLVFPGDEVGLNLLHDPIRFPRGVANSILKQVEHTVRSLLDNLERPAATIDVLPPDQTSLIVDGYSKSGLETEDSSILVRIEKAAASHPDTVALTGSGMSLTYSELIEQCHRLAGRLISEGVTAGDRIAVSMDRSPDAIVAALAAMRSGGTYVPLDPDLPPRRLDALLSGIDAKFMIVDRTRDTDLAGSAKVIDYAVLPSSAPMGDSGTLPDIDPEDLAYVIFTSGSTGSPKGVAVTHANLSHSTGARDPYYREDPNAFLLTSPTFFDSSMVGIFWTLATGGTLIVPEPNTEQDIPRLIELIEANSVTHILTLPSVYGLLLDAGEPEQLRTLRVAIAAGEPCPPGLGNAHVEKLPSTRLFNEYGPTEATVWVTVAELGKDPLDGARGRTSIGEPAPGNEVFVLDGARRPSPIGVVGEIYAGGPGVAAGYISDPSETARKFVEVDLPLIGTRRLYRTGDLGRWEVNGSLDLVGRIDDQVKIRGRRVEPGEIEHVLGSLAGVSAAAVVATPGPGGQASLAGFYVADSRNSVDSATLRDQLAEHLPSYLVPTNLLELDALPLTANGKLDRSALEIPDPTTADRGNRDPSTTSESMILAHARDLLGHAEINIDDNFFDAGGHSLLSMHLIARVFKDTGVRISPNLVLFNTLAFVAGVVAAQTGEAETGNAVTTANLSPSPQKKRVDDPRWFGGQRDIFGIFHRPKTDSSTTPIVICAPYGWEYFKTHWALRNLARLLWEEGHPVLRFDYRATGDSAGDPESLTVEGMVGDISAAIDEVIEATGAGKVHLVGLRLGATLAVVAADDNKVDGVTLWDPVISGASHLEQLAEMNHEFFSKESRRAAKRVTEDELLGSHYPPELRTGLESIDLHRSLSASTLPVRVFVSEMFHDYQVLRDVMGDKIDFRVVEDAGRWTDLATFNSALLPTNIPRQIVKSLAGGRE